MRQSCNDMKRDKPDIFGCILIAVWCADMGYTLLKYWIEL